jgi:hypothetical protein
MSVCETAELLLLAGRLVQAGGYDAIHWAGPGSPPELHRHSPSFKPRPVTDWRGRNKGATSSEFTVLTRTLNGSRATTSLPLSLNRRLALRPPAADRRRTKYPPASSDMMACAAIRRSGVCQDCAYLVGETCYDATNATLSSLKCLPFGVPIEPEDAGLLSSIFSQRASTAITHIMNESTSAICWKDA